MYNFKFRKFLVIIITGLIIYGLSFCSGANVVEYHKSCSGVALDSIGRPAGNARIIACSYIVEWPGIKKSGSKRKMGCKKIKKVRADNKGRFSLIGSYGCTTSLFGGKEKWGKTIIFAYSDRNNIGYKDVFNCEEAANVIIIIKGPEEIKALNKEDQKIINTFKEYLNR